MQKVVTGCKNNYRGIEMPSLKKKMPRHKMVLNQQSAIKLL